jgi:hypothetical protein
LTFFTNQSLTAQANVKINLGTSRRGLCASTPYPWNPVARFYNHTVFDKEWATLTIDEFHEFRTQSTGYWAVLSLLEKVKVVVGATATPLFNGFEVRILLLI